MAITKSAREILKQAKTLANADNSSFTNFFLSTTLLNNAYRDIYNKIVDNSLAFTNKVVLHEDGPLPSDFYSIISVERLPSKEIVSQRQIAGGSSNGYTFENGIFKYNHYPVEITYAITPATITAPDDPLEATITGAPLLVSNNRVTYNFDTKVATTTSQSSAKFLGKTIVVTWSSGKVSKITLDGEDVTSVFAKDDNHGKIISFQWHSPYAVVSYQDGAIYVFTGFEGAEWNINCIYGHETRAVCYGINTDDSTGYGMLIRFLDESGTVTGGYYWAPFVPDTILSYPSNAFFTLLEYKVAYVIAGLLNMSTDFIREGLEKAEVEFYKNIGGSTPAYRMNNYNSKRVFGGYY